MPFSEVPMPQLTCAACALPGILLPLTIRRKRVHVCMPCVTSGAKV